MRISLSVLAVFLWLWHVSAFAEDREFGLYFKDGSSELDMSYSRNSEVADSLVAVIKSSKISDIKYFIEGNASPSGTTVFNETLSRKRADAVLNYLRSRTEIPDSMVSIKAQGIDWIGLEKSVVADTALQKRKEVLDILRNTPIWVTDSNGKIVSSRKKQLMDLDYGRVYNILIERHFPSLRRALVALQYSVVTPVETDTVAVQDTVPSENAFVELVPSDTVEAPASKFIAADYEPLHRMALKSNLLYDAILMPSLEVEYRFNDKWSLMLEGDMAWWKNTHKDKYYQVATISPEGRYWFKTKKPWHGHFVGVFGGFTWYDLENGNRGYKGEAQMAGLTYGYMFPITRVLSFEASVGVGYLHTKYQEYLPIDGHFVYQQTSKLNYFGPLKLKFSLVWRFWDMNKKGGKR